jgi:hypothetical protein
MEVDKMSGLYIGLTISGVFLIGGIGEILFSWIKLFRKYK